jgi:hypothetical protein
MVERSLRRPEKPKVFKPLSLKEHSMITSTTKLIAAFAISAGLLIPGTTLAKGGPGKSGGSASNRSSVQKSMSNFNSFKLNSNVNKSLNLGHSNSISGISKKPVTLSQSFKKQDFNFKKVDINKDHKNSPLGISVNSLKKDNHKDLFCKKDNKCWSDWWFSKNHCYPYYFGCYYPLYDYCTPTYTTCNYTCSSLEMLPSVQPNRTLVAVGSSLMVNGQAFGTSPGGARLRISGMALPIEVLEWTPAGVTVRLPQIEITGVTPAEIEVFRGDGSLAAKTPVELTASPNQLVLGR